MVLILVVRTPIGGNTILDEKNMGQVHLLRALEGSAQPEHWQSPDEARGKAAADPHRIKDKQSPGVAGWILLSDFRCAEL